MSLTARCFLMSQDKMPFSDRKKQNVSQEDLKSKGAEEMLIIFPPCPHDSVKCPLTVLGKRDRCYTNFVSTSDF